MSNRRPEFMALAIGVVGLPPSPLFAAIASPRLIVTDFGKSRLEEISFFVISFLLLTAITRWIWNGFRKEFPQWPRFSYRGALGVMLLWGMACTIVISLVSAFRESMTPIDLETRQPARLTSATTPTVNPDIIERRIRMRSLWRSLSFYANTNNSHFPNSILDMEMGIGSPGADPATGLSFFITPDLKSTSPRTILASEPDIYQQRLLLFTDGTIVTEERSSGGRIR